MNSNSTANMNSGNNIKTNNEIKSKELCQSETINLVFESLHSSTGYIDYINSLILKIIHQYQANEIDKANKTFIEVVELLDLYIQLMTKVYSALRINFKNKPFKDEQVVNLEIHLLSIIKALLPAKEKGDIIMLCDLLEHELMDNLTQWKIKIIPELKKLKDQLPKIDPQVG